MKRSYAVIGLGRFGSHVALGLARQGLKPVAIDSTHEAVGEINEFVDDAYVLDATDAKALKEAGVVEFDVVVVAMADLEASILCVMALKELKNRLIIAKARNALHGEILAKVGAHKVVFPEREVARRLVADMARSLTFEMMDVSNTTRLAKLTVSDLWAGKKLSDLHKAAGEGVFAVGVRGKEGWRYGVEPSTVLQTGDVAALIGPAHVLEGFWKQYADRLG